MGCAGCSDTSGVGEIDAAGELNFNDEGAFIDSPKDSLAALGEGVDAGVVLAVASVGTGLDCGVVSSV